MTTTHRTITVPASSVETYRAMASTWPGGAGMFVTPCYDKNANPVYGDDGHGQRLPDMYISSGRIDVQVAAMLDDVPAFAAHAGITVEQAQALRDGMDVSEQSWQDHCERIGVTLEASDE